MDVTALLDGLSEAQTAAVTTPANPLCILAGAGSGKTRVVSSRIAWRVADGSADPRHVLAVTFTRRAAAELAQRLVAVGVRDDVAAGTFHAVALATLRRLWDDRRERPAALLERPTRLVARVVAPSASGPAPVADVAAEIEWAKSRLVGPGGYEEAAARAGRRPALPPAAVAACYARYEEEKRRRGLLDFSDVLLRCARAIERDPDVAAVERWRYRHLFVDEVQDANPLQWRLLRAWLGDRDDLCVVGDPAQAIYAWNGADPSLLDAFAARPDVTVVALEESFRSSPQVLAAAGAVGGAAPRSRRPEGPAPTVTAWPTDADEARGIARALRDRHAAGARWSSMAVLARTRAQAAELADAARALGVPVRTRSARRLSDDPDVAAALVELRRIGTGPLASSLADLATWAGDRTTPALDELLRLARLHVALAPGGGIDAFAAWLDATAPAERHDDGADAVDCTTFHAAKGLEWPVVFLAGLEDGLVPISHAEGTAAVAEERRLLYVALTRAGHEVHCSWARRRHLGGRPSARRPSPWLRAVAVSTEAGAVVPADWRAGLAEGRARLDDDGGRAGRRDPASAPPDAALRTGLLRWRARAARAARVDAAAVLDDRALDALVAARPADEAALAQVRELGAVVRARHGAALLRVVRQAARLPPRPASPASPAGTAR